MSDAYAVIDDRPAGASGVPVIDVNSSTFKFKRRRRPIENFNAIPGRVLRVLVQVNETGSYDHAARIDGVPAAQRPGTDRPDDATRNPDIACRVEP